MRFWMKWSVWYKNVWMQRNATPPSSSVKNEMFGNILRERQIVHITVTCFLLHERLQFSWTARGFCKDQAASVFKLLQPIWSTRYWNPRVSLLDACFWHARLACIYCNPRSISQLHLSRLDGEQHSMSWRLPMIFIF